MLYVSAHLPKTGGTTFRQILAQRFGNRLQLAYHKRENFPIVPDPECIHGHAVLRDFSHVISRHKQKKFLTFLRDPLRSAISYYYHNRKWSPVNHRGEPQEFDDRGLEAWLTHEEEYHWPNPPGYNHNRYSKWFQRHPIEEYDFLGITEQYDDSLILMYRHFGWDDITYKPDHVGEYAQPELDMSVIAKFRSLNAEDYRFYEFALAKLAKMRQEYGSSFSKDLAAFREKLAHFEEREPSVAG
jgi:hypothetical protein